MTAENLQHATGNYQVESLENIQGGIKDGTC
jgi:hypothetical protein